MPEFLTFFSGLLHICADLLMTEPFKWFTGIFVLLFIVSVVKRMID